MGLLGKLKKLGGKVIPDPAEKLGKRKFWGEVGGVARGLPGVLRDVGSYTLHIESGREVGMRRAKAEARKATYIPPQQPGQVDVSFWLKQKMYPKAAPRSPTRAAEHRGKLQKWAREQAHRRMRGWQTDPLWQIWQGQQRRPRA